MRCARTYKMRSGKTGSNAKKIDEALGAPGDAFYELEDELRKKEEPLPWCPEAVAVAEEQAPPDDGKPMPF